MSVVIQASGISKRYYLGEINQDAFFEDVWHRVQGGWGRVFGKPNQISKRKANREFWALKNVDLEVIHGQTLAVIGNNGAGKSTLLKVLSRITRPTTGEIKVFGRVASLLEVGTGFHPEFSGRDNIFLNGAILGLNRKEILKRFDQIETFAGIGEFIDEPVKRYSSGMYVRLAFSVAAFLNPEIMILDEVLAVGDMTFQQKCIDRVQEIMREGHAAILVSHSMHSVRRMADVCLWLKHGKIVMSGDSDTVTRAYEADMMHQKQQVEQNIRVHLEKWSVEGKHSADEHTVSSGTDASGLVLDIRVQEPIKQAGIVISILDAQGIVIYSCPSAVDFQNAGLYRVILRLTALPVMAGSYRISCTIFEEGQIICQSQAESELIVTQNEEKPSYQQGKGILNLPAKIEVSIIH